ncbi:MAG TPA: hypothetical protein VF532_15260 [Candidatus Angelobacter sp.]
MPGKTRPIVTVIVSGLLALAAGCNKPPSGAPAQAQQAAPFTAPQPQPAAAETKEIELAEAVVRILEAAHRSGAVIYRGSCAAERRIADRYLVREPLKTQPMNEALEEITRHYPELKWRDADEHGVRVRDSAVAAGLLKVRVKEFALIEDREPEAALAALWRSPEVISYMAAHGVRFARQGAAPRSRRKRAVVVVHMKDSTVEEIVQRIVASYPAAQSRSGAHRVWMYRECRAGAETVVEVKVL